MASYTELGKNKYKIYVELGYNERGKRLRKTKTITAKSERALKKAMIDFELEVRKNQAELDIENITFRRFVDRFMEMYVIPDLSINTRDTYNGYLDNGLLEHFGEIKLKNIKPFHIVEFFKKEKAAGRKSLTGKFLLLKSIFSKANKWEVLNHNPTVNVDPPETSKRYKDIEFYTTDQLKLLLYVLDNENVYPKHKMQIKMAVFGGLRKSEIAGLRVESIDFNQGGVFVDKQLNYDKETKRFLLGDTKTKLPRFVHLPEKFMKELKQYIHEQKKLKIKMGELWQPIKDSKGNDINLLFVKDNGKPTHINTISNEWVKIIRRYNLPHLNFHGLRHTHASYLLSNGANYKTIQEQLGHTDIRETINTYSHITEDFKRQEIKVFDNLL